MIDHHEALIYTMVLTSAADAEMTDAELRGIGEIVRFLPIFEDYEDQALPAAAARCAETLNQKDGIDLVIDEIVAAMPAKLAETAYALACDVAAADGKVSQEEARVLEILRHQLGVDRLAAAAIERGARARHRRL